MDRFAQPPVGEGQIPPEPPEEGGIKLNALDSLVNKTYFQNSRQNGINDKQALEFLITTYTVPENQTREYTNKVIELAKQNRYNPEINVTLDNFLRAKEGKEEEEKEQKEVEEQQAREGIPLEEQLAKAITEERYEDAAKLQEQVDRIKRMLGETSGYKGTLCLGDRV